MTKHLSVLAKARIKDVLDDPYEGTMYGAPGGGNKPRRGEYCHLRKEDLVALLHQAGLVL